jgi:glucose-1-phosphate cytidylyltransferase
MQMHTPRSALLDATPAAPRARTTKAVILAGGLGTRLSEETDVRPKPMVEIGGKPILWHIMKIYSSYGVNDFIICLGYKGYVIKEYFSNYFLHTSDITFDFRENQTHVHHAGCEPWRITLVDTGAESQTGGRLRRIKDYVKDESYFCVTYGDGVADIDIGALLAYHQSHGRMATVTGVQPPGRYGALALEGGAVTRFEEKPKGDGGWINGGFFVLHPDALDYIDGDLNSFEGDTLHKIAAAGELRAFIHEGFWQPMDTLRDKTQLEAMWNAGEARWKVWA